MAFEKKIMAERLTDLRKERELTFLELSKAIKEKLRVKISHSSLCDYEDSDKEKSMSLKNFIAIADFYEVPYDYLLGDLHSKEEKNIGISKAIGLSDDSIKAFKYIKNKHPKFLPLVNSLIGNNQFYMLIRSINNTIKGRLTLQREFDGIKEVMHPEYSPTEIRDFEMYALQRRFAALLEKVLPPISNFNPKDRPYIPLSDPGIQPWSDTTDYE